MLEDLLSDESLSCLTILLTLLATFITLLYAKLYKETERSSRELYALSNRISNHASGDIKSRDDYIRLGRRDKNENGEEKLLKRERMKKKVKRLTKELLRDKKAGVSALGLKISEDDRKKVEYRTLFDETVDNIDPEEESADWMKKCLLKNGDCQQSLKKAVFDLVHDVKVNVPTTIVMKMNVSEEGNVSLDEWETVHNNSEFQSRSFLSEERLRSASANENDPRRYSSPETRGCYNCSNNAAQNIADESRQEKPKSPKKSRLPVKSGLMTLLQEVGH